MTRRREAILVPLVVVALCVGTAVVWALRTQRVVRGRIEREDRALAVVFRLADAERVHREATGAYGWIAELRDAGRLGDLAVATLEGRAVVRSDGYRLDVLLPSNEVRLVPEPAASSAAPGADPEQKKRRFAVVARPLEPAVSGYRIWYLDERGEVYAAEGAVDLEARDNPLPDRPVVASGVAAVVSRLDWQRIR